MNGQHLGAFVWLRWRLLVNQLKRGGIANGVILLLLAVGLALLAFFFFVGCFLTGLLALESAPAPVLLLAWDGAVVCFLLCWALGLLSELQRSEALSLSKFLHLPVSLSGAFLLNYLSSLVSVTLILFVPALVGLSLGLALARGPALLVLFPLLASFLLMVTAATYQLQGWLAALMVNKRRRRTVVVVATVAILLLFQLPNLVNILHPWEAGPAERNRRQVEQETALMCSLAEGRLTLPEFERKRAGLRREAQVEAQDADERQWQALQRIAWIANVALPPGWLPLGAARAAEGDVVPALLGTLGMTLLGSASLWRAYRTTVRLYTGQVTAAPPAQKAPEKGAQKAAAPSASLLERELPWVSEQAQAVALATFRSLLRAPESKMMLLTPVLMLVVFGSVFLSRPTDMPESVRPLLAFGALALVLFSTSQLAGNQFGLDRGGFGVFVLSPAPRRDILLGKNLAVAPLALGLSAAAVALLQALRPMRLDHFLAAAPQGLTTYLLFCLMANTLSILAPVPLASGSLRASQPKGVSILFHLAFVFLFPLALSPALLPLGVEVAVRALGWGEGLPLCLLLSVGLAVAVVFVYRLVLGWQGELLRLREQRILEVVRSKVE